MAHIFVHALRREPLRSNSNGVPIPPTSRQLMAAFDEAVRYPRYRPSLMAGDTMVSRLITEIQSLVQGRSSDDEASKVAGRIARHHLNGF